LGRRITVIRVIAVSRPATSFGTDGSRDYDPVFLGQGVTD